jgi:hypothetical protein
MPLSVPKLDDRTFEQLVNEGRSLIPRYTKEWTNHNPSDPGITLLELFAWLAETGMFQLDRVPDASVEHFLKWVDVCRKGPPDQKEAIDETIKHALETIENVNRAVTAEDFEKLAMEVAAQAGTPLARTAFALYADEACGSAAASLSQPDLIPLAALVIVVPNEPANPRPQPTTQLTDRIYRRLIQHRLLTTRLHVIGPRYVEVAVDVTIVRKRGSGLTSAEIAQVIREFLHPLRGGPDGKGWQFGRAVFYSEMYQRLESLPKVDHVETLTLRTQPPGELTTEGVKIPSLSLVFAGNVAVTVRAGDG